jgi:hypothetical protein
MSRKLEDMLERGLLAPDQAGSEAAVEGASELEPLLRAAKQLATLQTVRPTPAVKARMRARLLTQIRVEPRRPWYAFLFNFNSPARPYRLATALALLVLVFLTAMTNVAQAALPGDFLYGWKRSSEKVWRAVHPDPLAADLLLTDRRADELVELTNQPERERLARAAYEESLIVLGGYGDPSQQIIIYQRLIPHQRRLAQVGASAVELDRLLERLAPAQPESPPEGEATPAPADAPLVTPDEFATPETDIPLLPPLTPTLPDAAPLIPTEEPGLPPLPSPTILVTPDEFATPETDIPLLPLLTPLPTTLPDAAPLIPTEEPGLPLPLPTISVTIPLAP